MIHYDYYADVPADVVDEVVLRAPLGRLVTASPGEAPVPHLGLYPFTYVPSAAAGPVVLGTVELHLHRDDEQLVDLRANAACLFEVDEVLGTIPSYWLDPDNAVFGTAYHRTIAFECRATATADGATLARQQNELLARYQPEGGCRPVDPDDPIYTGLLGMLVAVHLDITATKVKFKLAQNRTVAQRELIVRKLRERGGPGDAAAADAVQWTLDRTVANDRAAR